MSFGYSIIYFYPLSASVRRIRYTPDIVDDVGHFANLLEHTKHRHRPTPPPSGPVRTHRLRPSHWKPADNVIDETFTTVALNSTNRKAVQLKRDVINHYRVIYSSRLAIGAICNDTKFKYSNDSPSIWHNMGCWCECYNNSSTMISDGWLITNQCICMLI